MKKVSNIIIFSPVLSKLWEKHCYYMYVNKFLNCKQFRQRWRLFIWGCVTFGPDSEHFLRLLETLWKPIVVGRASFVDNFTFLTSC